MQIGNDPGPNGPPPTNVSLSAPTLEQQQRTVAPTEMWTDFQAKNIALASFQRMEGWRSSNHDWRFRTSDRLYLAYREKQTWEGTKMPRSSISIFLALEQIQSLMPSVVNALFSRWPATGTEEESEEALASVWR